MLTPSDATSSADVAIVGAGPLGLALALALSRNGRRVHVFDARSAEQTRRDARVLALSHGSRQLLQSLGAWPEGGATHIDTIHVSQRGALGRTLIRSGEYGVPALGYVAPAALLVEALAAAAARAGIQIDYDTRVTGIDPDADGVTLEVAAGDGTHRGVRAQLAACCEGAIDTATARVFERDYQQHALLCRVTPRTAHGHVAFERFTPDGPIALLPLGADYSVVWTVSPQRLAELQQLDDDALLAALQTAFGGHRVSLTRLRDRASFPLGLRVRHEPVGARTVWLGNAAQTLHPVAGQGFNLALRDAWELADELGTTGDAGDAATLAAYVRRRRVDRAGTIGFTDSLVRMFSNGNPLMKHLRGAGLLALDVAPPLRHFVAKRMMFGARAWP
ncbi:MAG: FAD-dependent oxidoreductase [Rhodocyclaceae bacterium]